MQGAFTSTVDVTVKKSIGIQSLAMMDAQCSSCALNPLTDSGQLAREGSADATVVLAGNPNVGKTSVFNALTGLRQHTGNWPGKTVLQARGFYPHRDKRIEVVDLPGTYSLSARSPEEEVARDAICFGNPDVTVVVVDATALERNLNLVLQIAEVSDRIVVCVNLLDEARRKHVWVDLKELALELGLPVVGTVALARRGILELKDAIDQIVTGQMSPSPKKPVYSEDVEAAIVGIVPSIQEINHTSLPDRWIALRILEGDDSILGKLEQFYRRDDATMTEQAMAS